MSDYKDNEFGHLILRKNGITSSSNLKMYGKAYEFWKTSWLQILEKAGCPGVLQVDDFYRQDLISLITHKDDIVALMLHTFFDLKNPVTYEMRYFSIFNEWSRKNIEKHGHTGVMTMEYLLVNPEWRKKNGAAFSFSDVIMGLAFQIMKSEGAGISLGVAIKAAKMDEMAQRLHCQVLERDVKRGSIVCDIVSQIPSHIKPHADSRIQSFTETLWNNRTYSDSIKTRQPLRKAA